MERRHVSLAANKVWTRGPTHWRHVSLSGWFLWLVGICVKCFGSAGFDPGTSSSMQRLNKHSASQLSVAFSLLARRGALYLKLHCLILKGARAEA